MREIRDQVIDNWIKDYASISGKGVSVDESLRKINSTRYFLHQSLPNLFESYAIILHSFWINNKIDKNKIKLTENDDFDYPEEDFERVKWSEYFANYGEALDLETCFESNERITSENKQYNNILYPGEGLCDKEHLISLKELILNIYGDEYVNFYYTFLGTNDWEKDKFYNGKISEIEILIKDANLRNTPNLIYPDNKKWALNTDYDLPFSFIGGEKKLIDDLIKNNKNEIFQISY